MRMFPERERLGSVMKMRERRIRLSDEEVQLIDECREIMYPKADDGEIPRGLVVRRLAEQLLKAEQYKQ